MDVTWLARRIRPALHRVIGPGEVTCTLFDGQRLRVVLPEIVGTAVYRDGIIERPLTQVLLDRLRPGMTFIDVGAQYGYFSVLAARLVSPSGTVIAFEPGRSAARLLRHNVTHLDVVRTEEAAVDAGPGRARLHDFGPRQSALNTVLGGARVPHRYRRRLHATVYDVPTVALDDYTAAHGLRPDIVKLDAEGSELAIITGMERVLREVGPLVSLETGDYDGMASPSTGASIDALERFGYRCFDYEDGAFRTHRRRSRYDYGNLFFLPTDA